MTKTARKRHRRRASGWTRKKRPGDKRTKVDGEDDKRDCARAVVEESEAQCRAYLSERENLSQHAGKWTAFVGGKCLGAFECEDEAKRKSFAESGERCKLVGLVAKIGSCPPEGCCVRACPHCVPASGVALRSDARRSRETPDAEKERSP